MKFIKLLSLQLFVHASNITPCEIAEINGYVYGLVDPYCY